MPKTYDQVYEEYQQFRSRFPDDPTPMQEFAKQADTVDGTPGERGEAYENGTLKQINAFIGRGFEQSGLPTLARGALGPVAGLADEAFGTDVRPTVEGLAGELPRMVVESALTIPAAATGVGAPAAAAVWANRLNQLRKAVGYGSAFTRGTAQTDSVLGGALEAGSMGLSNKLLLPATHGGMDVGRGAAAKVWEWMGDTPAKAEAMKTAEGLLGATRPPIEAITRGRALLPVTADLATQAGVNVGINEATRQGQLSVGPNAVAWNAPERNPLSPENVAGQVVGLMGMVPQTVTTVRGRSVIGPEQVRSQLEWDTTRRKYLESQGMKPGETESQFYSRMDPYGTIGENVEPGAETPNRALGQDYWDQVEKSPEVIDAERKYKLPLTHEVDALSRALAQQRRNGDAMVPETEKRLRKAVELLIRAGGKEGEVVDLETPRYRETEGKTREMIGEGGVKSPEVVDPTFAEGTVKSMITGGGHPKTPAELTVFGRAVNQLIDFINVNTDKFTDLDRLEHMKGKTWHPNAVESDLVTRYQKEGFLPKFTWDEIQKVYNVTAEEFANPSFAAEVAVQRFANRILDMLPEAKARAKEKAVVETELSPRQKELETATREMADGIAALPETLSGSLWERTLEYMDMPAKFVKGKAMSRLSTWRKTLAHAGKTYDPVTGTVEVYVGRRRDLEGGKGEVVYKRIPVEDLIGKRDTGEWLYEPRMVPVKVGEGGGSKKERLFSDLTIDERQPDFPDDLEDVKIDLTERGEGMGGTLAERESVGESGTFTPPETQGEVHPALVDATQTMNKTLDQGVMNRINTALKTVAPERLYNAVEHLFTTERRLTEAVRQRKIAYLPLALRAAMEDWQNKGAAVGPAGTEFLAKRRAEGFNPVGEGDRTKLAVALRDFFMYKTPVKGVESTARNDLVRVGEILKVLGKGDFESMPKSALTNEQMTTLKKGQTGADRLRDMPGFRSEEYERGQPVSVDMYGIPGALAEDALPRLLSFVDRTLSQAGYSGDVRGLYANITTALWKQLEKSRVALSISDQLGGGEAGFLERQVPFARRGMVRVGTGGSLSSLEPAVAVREVLGTLSHEIHHINDWIAAGYLKEPDAFSAWQREHVLGMRRIAEVLTDDERNVLLKTLARAFTPEGERQTLQSDGYMYGSHDPVEFTAKVNEVLDRALLAVPEKRRDVMDVLRFAPEEVKRYAEGYYRSVYDVLGSFLDAVESPTTVAGDKKGTFLEFMVGRKDAPQMATHLAAIVMAAKEGSRLGREGDITIASAGKYLQSLSAKAAQGIPSPASRVEVDLANGKIGETFPTVKRMVESPSPTVDNAVDMADRLMRGSGTEPGLWTKLFYPFYNNMESMAREGNPLARSLAELSIGVAGAVKRTYSELMSPLLVREKDGSYALNREHRMVQVLMQDPRGKWRGAFDRLSAWQQEQGAMTSMFVKGTDGQIVVNPESPKAQAKWDEVKKGLSLTEQQDVAAAMVAFDEIGQIAAQRLIGTMQKSNAYRVASTLLASRSMTWEQALQVAERVQKAFTVLETKDVDPALRAQAQAEVTTLLGEGPELRRVAMLLSGPDGLIQKTAQVARHLEGRKGFRTESLPGDWLIRFKRDEGKDVKWEYLSARTQHEANWRMRKLKEEGMVVDAPVRKGELRNYDDFESPDAILHSFVDLERDAWNKYVETMRAEYGDDFAQKLRGYDPGEATSKELQTRGLSRFLTKRESKVARDKFDYIDATFDWIGKLSASMSYRLAKQHKNLILSDPRNQNFPWLKAEADPHFENLMAPTPQLAKEMRTFASAYMMGGNLSSALINATQSLTTLVPVLIHQAKNLGPAGAYARVTRALGKAVEVSTGDHWKDVAAAAERRDPSGKTWTEEESQAVLYKRSVADGGITHGVILDDIFAPTDTQSLLTSKFGHGEFTPVSKGQMVRDAVYVGAQWSMKPFGWVEAWNNKIALMSGVEQGYRDGLRGDALYDYANRVKYLSTFGGGKANAPGFVGKASTPFTRGAVGMLSVLQQYGFGTVATYAQQIKDAIGQSPGLSTQEKRQAQKAFATMMATQLAVGGALGLPFAAAGLKMVEQLFGIPADQMVREGLASLGREDEEDSTGAGAILADTALNGLANQMFGLDLSSRVGVSSVLGTSAYRGFNLQDMAGPVVSVMSNMAQSLNLFSSNQPEKAARMLVPTSLKNAVDMYNAKRQYGDYGIRDAGGNLLYTPTDSQASWYALGVRPKELSQKRAAQGVLLDADKRANSARDRVLEEAGQALLQGDTGPATRLVADMRSADPTINPQETYRAIVKRMVDAQTEKDLLATGSRWNEEERTRIARSFGPGVITRQSEVQRVQQAAQLGMRLGVRPDPADFRRAALVDALVQQRGMPRSQAVRLAEFLQ